MKKMSWHVRKRVLHTMAPEDVRRYYASSFARHQLGSLVLPITQTARVKRNIQQGASALERKLQDMRL